MKITSLKCIVTLVLVVLLSGDAAAQSNKNAKNTKSRKTAQTQSSSKKTTSDKGKTITIDTTGYAAANAWASKKMKHLSLEEKVGQLMFVRVPTSMNKKQRREFEKNFTSYNVGGVCFFKGTAANQLSLTKHYQHQSDIPLMVTIDAEWGLGMRLTDCYSFPRQMLMGALSANNDTLIAQFGEEVGRQCRKMGIHVNFAPVCDINNNPDNPVIGSRSFGENKKRVARKSAMYARGMQRMGVIAVGKHFPGHGDTDVDSHLDLPNIKHSAAYIDSVDLFPFRHLVNNGIRGMMVAHLQVNAFDDRPHMPSSLSELIVMPLLRNQMRFDGLVFTDGIDMKAVSKHYKDGEGAIRAIRAGSDVILLPIDVKKTINAVVAEAERDTAFARMVDDRCRRILREKYLLGLDDLKTDRLAVPNAADRERSERIASQMAQKALTLVYNDYALPLKRSDMVVNVAVGDCDTAITTLDSTLINRIARSKNVVIHLYGHVGAANNYGVSNETVRLVNRIAAIDSVNSILVIYGSPYILQSFPNPQTEKPQTLSQTITYAFDRTIMNPYKGPTAIVMAYQNCKAVTAAVPKALYGESPFEGKLPVTSGGYKEGTSLKPKARPQQSQYDRVRQAGMDVRCFVKIDSIARAGIAAKAYPGCQILVAKGGKIVYNSCYGHQTYNPASAPMDTNTVYDLASLTKVTATNLAVMMLVDQGKIQLDDKLSRYLPYLKHTNKSRITVRQALSHYARLKAFDSYWKAATTDGSIYRGTTPPDGYIAVGDNVYINPRFREQVLHQIAKSDLQKQHKYLYSDLGFILLADMVEHVSGQSLDIFMQQHFYGPLGMKNTTFQPLQHGIALNRIAPTEQSTDFRGQLIHGYVHDPNAAAMGGVSGHAGLFSTGNDLFRIYQMMLNEGSFNGKQYISSATFNTFNSRHYANKGNRRALGFDKPLISGKSSHVSPLASQKSFGHTGFTGIMVWVDPQYDLIFLFLSNRVYPSSSPNKLSSMNIRTDIQHLIYQSMGLR